MSTITREELASLKRPALQQKCKELGIKANSKSEVLIDLILNHYKSEAGQHASGPSSQPTTSRKRKAAAAVLESHPAEEVANDEQTDDDAVVSAPQRQASTRRKAAQNSTAPPPAKIRRLGTRTTRTKIEPVDDDVLPTALQASPRRGRVMEVVLTSPSKLAKGKGKGKERAVKAGPSAEDAATEIDDIVQDASTAVAPQSTARPLGANSTSVTVLDTTNEAPLQPQLDAHETRITDLELQIRNARKSGDDSARGVLAMKAFQHAIQQALGDNSSSDTLDSMGQLAKLRDIAPRLIALSNLDADALTSRVESIERQVDDFDAMLQKDQSAIAELQERVRELEEGKSAVGDLEALVRKLQSDFNRIPDSVFDSNKPEDSGSDRVYTIIRPPSRGASAAPSSSQHQRPSSRLSIPPEDSLLPPTQDQNTGRSSSVARSIRASRPPLAEKEGIRVGQPDVEVETADPRRSIRRLAESLPPSTSNSAPSSRARSTTPNRRESSSAAPSPSRGKGKGRLNAKATTLLDTVNEDADMDGPEEQSAVINALTTAADPFTPTMELPRSPPAFVDASRRESFGSPPPSATKSLPKVSLFQGLVPTLSTASTLDDSGPIAELPFKLVASPAKPQENSNPTTSRSAPTGRVGRAPYRSHNPYTRPGGSRTTTSESVTQAAETQTSMFNFALPGPTAQPSSALGATNSLSESSAGFITPERLGANFNLFPTRIDLGRTPGGLAFKTTGRAPPGTPAVTTTLFGTEVARDTRFADLPYDPDASRGSLSWEEGIPLWPAGVPRNASNQ